MVSARSGSPEKKSVSPRYEGIRRHIQGSEGDSRTFSRYCRRSATASLSLSANTGSYRPSRDFPAGGRQ